MSKNYKINVNEKVNAKESLRADNFDSQNHLQGISVVSDEFETSSKSINGLYEEKAKVKIPRKRAKEQEEINTVQRFLPIYNSSHGTDYGNPQGTDQNSDIDVFSDSPSGHQRISFQITVSEEEAHRELGRHKYFQRSFTGSDPWIKMWKERINAKSDKYPFDSKKDIVLLLDGWYVAYHKDIEAFKTKESSFLHSTGFKEIWFVGHTNELIIKLV